MKGKINPMQIPLTADQQQWVDSTLASMNISQCLGQLLCAYDGRNTIEDWLELIEKVPIGAITVRNATTEDMRKQLQALQANAEIPLLVTADLEHGAIALTDGTEFPWMMGAGAANDTELMRIMGQATASEARHAGLHWTFSPVIDLNYNFNNPITNIRALSDQPERVIRLATAYIKGLQADSLFAGTAKHFPGDGLDDRDQHLVTTVNNLPFEEWQETYGRVWRAAIQAGVMTIMPGHISLPDYQGYATHLYEAPPATMSSRLLNDLLRNELGFEGLLISDASRMIGMTSRVSIEDIAVECIKAGMDMLLFPETEKDFNRLLQAVRTGRLSEERVMEATRRVLVLKAQLNLHVDPFGEKPSDTDKQQFQQAAVAMAEKSITIIRSDERPPINLKPGSKVLTITIGKVSQFSRFVQQPELEAFDEALRERGFEVDHLLNPADDVLAEKVAASDVVFLNLIALPYMELGTIRNLVGHLGHWNWRSLFVDHPNVLVTSFGNPYVLYEMPHLPNLLAAYGDSKVSQQAAVRVWLGEIEPQGDCPVTLPQISIQPLSQ